LEETLEGQRRTADARELYQKVADKDWGPQYRAAMRTASSKLR
jgi:hypothetical protein